MLNEENLAVLQLNQWENKLFFQILFPDADMRGHGTGSIWFRQIFLPYARSLQVTEVGTLFTCGSSGWDRYVRRLGMTVRLAGNDDTQDFHGTVFYRGTLQLHYNESLSLNQVLIDAEMIRRMKYCIISGMGGSGLSVSVVNSAFRQMADRPQPVVLQTTDPAVIKDILENIARRDSVSLKEILQNLIIPVISKSGVTAETESHWRYFKDLYAAEKIDPKGHFIFYSDPGSPLFWQEHQNRALTGLAAERQRLLEELQPVVRPIQLNGRADVGGRFTAPTTAVFLLPLALQFRETERSASVLLQVLKEADRMNSGTPYQDPFIHLAAFLYYMAAQLKKDKLTFIVPEELKDLPVWAEQLFMESLGKNFKGIEVYSGEDLNMGLLKDVATNDRVFLRINLAGQETQPQFTDRLKNAGYPLFDIPMNSIEQIGGVMLGLERTVALIAFLWDIVFVDQPGVESYKQKTRALMANVKPGELVQVPPEWTKQSARYKDLLSISYAPYLEAGQQRHKMSGTPGKTFPEGFKDNLVLAAELDAELNRLNADRNNAPAVYAALINITHQKGGLQSVRTLCYGHMTDELAAILQKSRSVYSRALRVPTYLIEGPGVNHASMQSIMDGPDRGFNTIIMPAASAQPDPAVLKTGISPEMLRYDENLLRGPTIGTIQALIEAGRGAVLINLNKEIGTLTPQDLADLSNFFREVAGYLKPADHAMTINGGIDLNTEQYTRTISADLSGTSEKLREFRLALQGIIPIPVSTPKIIESHRLFSNLK
jgi:glucose-6-phosphate isomerase